MIFTFGSGHFCTGKFVVSESRKEIEKIFGDHWAFEYADTPEQRREMHHYGQHEIKIDVAEKMFIIWRTRIIHNSLKSISNALDNFAPEKTTSRSEIKQIKVLMDGQALFELELEKIAERSEEIIQKDRQERIPDYYNSKEL